MLIYHKESGKRGMFYIEDDDEIIAEIVYADGGNNTMIIEHTDIDERLQGMNIGYELVNRVVEHARMHGMKVTPVCPFAKAVFDKKADFRDVLV